MPTRPPTVCNATGCYLLADGVTRYCPQHRPRARVHPSGQRLSPTELGYDHRWRAYALAFLREHPWCEYCARRGVATPSTCVEHRVAPRGDRRLFWDPANHAAACGPCNSSKAVQVEGALGHDPDQDSPDGWRRQP
jgi:5-methylcytosine-specific restriction protein A